MVRELDGLAIGVLNRVFDVLDAHRPGTNRATNLNLTRASDALLVQLLRCKVRRGEEEGHMNGMVLVA